MQTQGPRFRMDLEQLALLATIHNGLNLRLKHLKGDISALKRALKRNPHPETGGRMHHQGS